MKSPIIIVEISSNETKVFGK